MHQDTRRGAVHLILLLIIAAVLAAGWWFFMKPDDAGAPPLGATPATENPSLGGEVYAQTQNPLADKLPETSASVPNPVEDIYKNPFD